MEPAITTDQTETATVLSSQKAEDRAYRESTMLSVPQIAGYLLNTLGQRLTAVGVGLSDARPVRYWEEGKDIREENEARLRCLYRVTLTVALVHDEQTARAFLRSSNPYLDDDAPIEVIAAGEQRRVLEAVRNFLDG